MRSWLIWLMLRGGLTVESWEMRDGKWVHLAVIIGGPGNLVRFLIDGKGADKAWHPTVSPSPNISQC